MSIYSKRNVWCAIVLYFTLIQGILVNLTAVGQSVKFEQANLCTSLFK
jgi:hypothetical protein